MSMGNEKARVFVDHLYNNPALRDQNPLQREEHIIQFLHKNATALIPTLTSVDFFPGLSWDRIVQMLADTLQEKINTIFVTNLREVITNNINYNFLRDIKTAGGALNYDLVQQQIEEMLLQLLSNTVARRLLNGSYNAVYYDLISRYINVIYTRKSYVYYEITKVQKLDISPDSLGDLIKVTMLLMPAIWISSRNIVPSSKKQIEIDSDWVERAFAEAHMMLRAIPEEIIKCALRASLSFTDYSDVETTSRLATLFVSRARNYSLTTLKDKGAESPDKSWFSIARKNYKYYGYDSKMLEELYSIASDNQW